MDKKWLLASVMLAALSLSGCDNTPGTHANNSGSAKSGSQAAGETHTAATSGTQQPAATAGTQAVQPAASASNTTAPSAPATPSTASLGSTSGGSNAGSTSGGTKTAQTATAQPTAETAATGSTAGQNAVSSATSAALSPRAAGEAANAGVTSSAPEFRLASGQQTTAKAATAPVPGAARPGISGARTAANIAPQKSKVGPLNGATGHNEAPVLGAAFSGISGATKAAALGPESAKRRTADTAAMNGAVGYDEQPVFGAAFSGISGATSVADLMPRAASRGSQELAQANTEASGSSQQAAQTNAAVGYDDQPVFGAAFSGISGATKAADLMPYRANRGSQQLMQASTEASSSSQQVGKSNTAVGYDDQPVFGAAFSGISGASNTADLMPRRANRGSRQLMQANTEASSSQQVVQSNAAVGYDDHPVFGAAFSGISGATNAADLMPRNTKGGVRQLAQGTTEANRSSQEASQTNPAASYDEQPVLGAAASGISGAADAAGLGRRTGNNTRVNNTPGKNAGTSNSQAGENQPVRDAAYSGISGVPIARLVSDNRDSGNAIGAAQNDAVCSSNKASGNQKITNQNAIDLNYCRLYFEPATGAAHRGASASGDNNPSSS